MNIKCGKCGTVYHHAIMICPGCHTAPTSKDLLPEPMTTTTGLICPRCNVGRITCHTERVHPYACACGACFTEAQLRRELKLDASDLMKAPIELRLDADGKGCPDPRREAVDHPAHYGGADNVYEAIKVIIAWRLGFCLGNAIKYIARAGKKDRTIEDLKKARWYIDYEIKLMEGGPTNEDGIREFIAKSLTS